MSSFVLTRRNALLGGFSSLLLPATTPLVIETAKPLDPWEQVAVHAFAMRDAMQNLPEERGGNFWWAKVDANVMRRDGLSKFDPAIFFYNPATAGLHYVDRPKLGAEV